MPHRDGFAALKDVTLHFLDWGGRGPIMLLIPGLGNTAHTYDDFAPHFTDRFRVVGLTLRGHGQSDKPAAGYDTATIVEDVRQWATKRHKKAQKKSDHPFFGYFLM